MIKKTFTITCALGLVLCLSQTSLGCDCPHISVADAFAEADAVFVGKVIKIALVKEASVGMAHISGKENLLWKKFVDEAQSVTLEVSEAFKGVTSKAVEVTSAYASCGLEFKEGGSYLVYANKRGRLLSADAAKLPKESWTREMRLRSEADKLNAKLPPLADGSCSRTNRLSLRGEDLNEIRHIIKK